MSGTVPRGSAGRPWWTLLAVSLGSFMAYLDNNVVNVALPSIQRSLRVSISGLEWVVSAYILVFAGLMLVGGRLADVYGRRRVFAAGLAVFTLGSLSAGLAGSESVLIAGRAVQGLGAAMLMPATLAIIQATFAGPTQRTRAIGIWSAVGALALALGPLTGGLISQHLHWGWIFLINVPVGVAAFVITLFAMPESREDKRRRLDLPGLASSAVALSALTYALIEGHDDGWTSATILGAFGLAVLAVIVFLLVESRGAEPMIDLTLFRDRAFTGGTAALIVWGFGVMGIYFFTAMYLQNIMGFSPTKAGLAFVPMALIMVAASPLAAPVANRIGPHRSVALGLVIVGLSMMAVPVFVGPHSGLWALMPEFIPIGAGSSLIFITVTTVIVGVLPPDRAGAGSALLNTAREVSSLFGITIVGAILAARETAVLSAGSTQTHAFLEGYKLAIVVAAAIVLAGAPVTLATLRRVRSARSAEHTVTPGEPVEEAALR